MNVGELLRALNFLPRDLEVFLYEENAAGGLAPVVNAEVSSDDPSSSYVILTTF